MAATYVCQNHFTTTAKNMISKIGLPEYETTDEGRVRLRPVGGRQFFPLDRLKGVLTRELVREIMNQHREWINASQDREQAYVGRLNLLLE